MAALSRALVAILAGATLASCEKSLAPLEPMPGMYVLTTYMAGPTRESRMDMIALGVRWTLDVESDNSVVSTTWIQGDTIAQPVVRHGTVRRRGSDVTLQGFDGQQGILTLRQWTLDGDQLVAIDQTVSGVNATMRFTRQ